MTVVARMRCNWTQNFASGSKVNLTPIYVANEDDPHYEEIKYFMKSTPSGVLEMTIDNPLAAEQFRPGQDYYVSLEPVPAWSPDDPTTKG